MRASRYQRATIFSAPRYNWRGVSATARSQVRCWCQTWSASWLRARALRLSQSAQRRSKVSRRRSRFTEYGLAKPERERGWVAFSRLRYSPRRRWRGDPAKRHGTAQGAGRHVRRLTPIRPFIARPGLGPGALAQDSAPRADWKAPRACPCGSTKSFLSVVVQTGNGAA